MSTQKSAQIVHLVLRLDPGPLGHKNPDGDWGIYGPPGRNMTVLIFQVTCQSKVPFVCEVVFPK